MISCKLYTNRRCVQLMLQVTLFIYSLFVLTIDSAQEWLISLEYPPPSSWLPEGRIRFRRIQGRGADPNVQVVSHE